MKDHEIALVVNRLRDIAIDFHAAGQLRARIADLIVPLLKGVPFSPSMLQTDPYETQLHAHNETEAELLVALANITWAASELDKKNRIRQFDKFIDEARELIGKQASRNDLLKL